jgi:hypothetical protein
LCSDVLQYHHKGHLCPRKSFLPNRPGERTCGGGHAQRPVKPLHFRLAVSRTMYLLDSGD